MEIMNRIMLATLPLMAGLMAGHVLAEDIEAPTLTTETSLSMQSQTQPRRGTERVTAIPNVPAAERQNMTALSGQGHNAGCNMNGMNMMGNMSGIMGIMGGGQGSRGHGLGGRGC